MNEHARQYGQQICEMISRNACRKVSKSELESYKGPIYYIAHHAVFKPESKSTPCRIVFNSSANIKGHVLNDYYCKGPDMLNTLIGILIRFRENYIAIVGDVSKMFHSIKIPLQDQMTHLFLWRNLETNREPDTYAMTAVNMGDRPSATIAITALKKTAEMSETEYPIACKAIKNNSYMDDIIETTNNTRMAIKVAKDIDTVLRKGGFHIKEWIIFGVKTIGKETFTTKIGHTTPNDKDTSQKIEKVLGMKWDNLRDCLVFDVNKHLQKELISSSLTKRFILSLVNGIYDPIGLLSPYTVRGKIMLRKLWTWSRTLTWDEPVPKEIEKEWLSFLQSLHHINEITFPRSIKAEYAVEEPVLVIFSDASREAYGSAAYARWKIEPELFQSRLIIAKNRVAPLKTIDIVRLELIGAVLSKRLRCVIEKEMNIKFQKVYHIVDSEIVKAMRSKES